MPLFRDSISVPNCLEIYTIAHIVSLKGKGLIWSDEVDYWLIAEMALFMAHVVDYDK